MCINLSPLDPPPPYYGRRHLKAPEEGGKRVCTGGRGVSMTWPENSRKLQSEEIILAKKPGRFGGDRGYFTAKVIDEAGGGHYRYVAVYIHSFVC